MCKPVGTMQTRLLLKRTLDFARELLRECLLATNQRPRQFSVSRPPFFLSSASNMAAEDNFTPFPHFATNALHEGQEPEQWKSMAVVPPISTATTFKQFAPSEHAVNRLEMLLFVFGMFYVTWVYDNVLSYSGADKWIFLNTRCKGMLGDRWCRRQPWCLIFVS